MHLKLNLQISFLLPSHPAAVSPSAALHHSLNSTISLSLPLTVSRPPLSPSLWRDRGAIITRMHTHTHAHTHAHTSATENLLLTSDCMSHHYPPPSCGCDGGSTVRRGCWIGNSLTPAFPISEPEAPGCRVMESQMVFRRPRVCVCLWVCVCSP